MAKGEATLSITLSPNGDVSVSGPVQNKMLCYALLELGRDCIKDAHDTRAKEKKLETPTTNDILNISKGRTQ